MSNKASVCDGTVYLKVAEIYAEVPALKLRLFMKTRPEQAQQLLSQCVTVYQSTKTIHKFTQLEFTFGNHGRARTLFEGLITQNPKQKDIWNVFVDLEIPKGIAVQVICGLYSAMLDLRLGLLFQKAQSYVASKMSSQNSASNKCMQNSDNDDNHDNE
ncbi:hypothetical protein MJO28_010651 [Puccinia striiformis f. sp. tritici]|uniref:Uncharacterized protein n=1 Tax=Puccinia striiformis f. sp. tritici TaxID=168172 RepID=A0ACC0E6D9_9BASI|nr:hypothetical protein MJO28_010651 [Puccinia striiformis f. sp. tritici]